MSVCPLKDGRHVRAINISLQDNGVSVAQELKEGLYKSESWWPDLAIPVCVALEGSPRVDRSVGCLFEHMLNEEYCIEHFESLSRIKNTDGSQCLPIRLSSYKFENPLKISYRVQKIFRNLTSDLDLEVEVSEI